MAPVHHILPLAAALTEPAGTAVFLLVFGVLIGVSVLFSRMANRLGVPIVLLFLVLGMLGGSEAVGGLAFDNYHLAAQVGTAALVLILFDGGLNTTVASIRRALLPSMTLATIGVAATAALLAAFAWSIGLPLWEAALLGAVVSSTDAAAVFAVLRGGGLNLAPRLRALLEVESCVNDPMAVILTVSIIESIVATSAGGGAGEPLAARLLVIVPMQLAIGGGVGLAVGLFGRWLLPRVTLGTVGLYPALTLALALLSFGAATLSQGSGFLSVYLTGVMLGNSGNLPYRSGLTRIHDALAWLSQISMFLMLGLLVYPSRLVEIAGVGLAIALFLALVARPVAVSVCLLPFRIPMRQVAYIGWVGLRGAVPIVLGTYPMLGDVPGAERIFTIVFFVVVVSSLIPGATLQLVTRWFGFDIGEQPTPPAVLEINSPYPLDGELLSFHITPDLAVSGARLSEVEFPPGASVVLVVRGRQLVPAKGNTTIEPEDHVYVYCQRPDRPFVELLFGRPEEGV